MSDSYRFSSIQEIHQAYLSGEATVKLVTSQFLDAIETFNPKLHAVIETNPDALILAEQMDQELADLKAKAGPLPLLFGIPVLLKDNISTGDKTHTSAGAAALGDLLAPEDAPCVKNLRNAGALILGKANLTEFANYVSDPLPNGFTARGGQTKNPYGEELDPLGSSSGSAVVVAAGLCTVAVGTETSGSILSPSSANGVIGCKPTAGVVSNEAVIPISPTLDTPGPMARSAKDLAVLLAALSGMTREDFSKLYEEQPPVDLSKVRLGVVVPQPKEKRPSWGPDDKACTIFGEFVKAMESAGISLDKDAIRGSNKGIMDIMKYEIKGAIKAFLDNANKNGERTKMHSLKDIIEYVHAHPEAAPYGYGLLEAREEDTSGLMNEPEYYAALEARKQEQNKMQTYFVEHSFDAIVSVDFPVFAPFGGFPAVAFPLGFNQNEGPFAAFFYAAPGKDLDLIRLVDALSKLPGCPDFAKEAASKELWWDK